MNESLLIFLVGSACFGLSTVFAIRLSPNLTVPVSAAIAPAVAIAGASSHETESVVMLLSVPLVVAVISLALVKRSVLEITGHVALFSATAIALKVLAGARLDENTITTLLSSLSAGAIYLFGDFVRQISVGRGRVRVRGVGKMLVLLQMVVLSACGLTVLVVSQLGWGAFIAMAAVLAITRNEFEAFGKSRTAYEQTTTALAKLRLRANQDGTGIASFLLR